MATILYTAHGVSQGSRLQLSLYVKEMEDSLTWVMWSNVLTGLQSFMKQYEYVAANFLIFLEI